MKAISRHYPLSASSGVPRLENQPQRGVVLIVALILLVVLSLVSAAAIRGSSSAELSTNNTRTQTLAMQAAEAALRYCEKATLNFMAGGGALPTLTPEAAPAAPLPYRWQTLSNWDGAGSGGNITTLVSADINDRADDAGKLYKRYPECTAQYLEPANVMRVVVTARGFGPDVAAINGARSAPTGAEVWLQSVLSAD